MSGNHGVSGMLPGIWRDLSAGDAKGGICKEDRTGSSCAESGSGCVDAGGCRPVYHDRRGSCVKGCVPVL